MIEAFDLPDTIRGRSLTAKVIPTVCNLSNMIEKLRSVDGDYSKLKQWEKRSYKAYRIELIKNKIMNCNYNDLCKIIKQNLLSLEPIEIGASAVDIYLVGYVTEKYGTGKDIFYKYIKNNNISSKENSAGAIWQVGKGDGVFLDILNEDGRIKDWQFINKLVR